MAFVFWQNVASRHQRDLLRAIAAASGDEVVCAVERELPPDRAAFGWCAEDFAPVKLARSDDRATFESLVARTGDIHVMTGFLHHPVIRKAFRALACAKTPLFLQSESVDFHGSPGALRMLRDRLKATRHRKHVRGAFAIGKEAVRYLAILGFRPNQIVPFGYFVSTSVPTTVATSSDTAFRLVFAGQFIRRKGIDILIEALARVAVLDWRLEMIGSGKDEGSLRARAAQLGLSERIVWKGAVAPDTIPHEFAGADLMVLPSRWDGWGVVVNESLAVGVPVVCSDRCGAATVLNDRRIGETFPVSDAGALAVIVRRRIEAGRIPETTLEACRAAAAALTPEAGARQFIAGISAITSGAKPPLPPWMRHLSPLHA